MLFGDEVVPRDLSKPVVIVDHAEAVFGPANEVLIHAVGDFVDCRASPPAGPRCSPCPRICRRPNRGLRPWQSMSAPTLGMLILALTSRRMFVRDSPGRSFSMTMHICFQEALRCLETSCRICFRTTFTFWQIWYQSTLSACHTYVGTPVCGPSGTSKYPKSCRSTLSQSSCG